ncbi:hypothetical protein N180_01550 [Pedobacter antarcticus 4BY]|uniref:DUF1572 domain-containing protein n=2 Tax=Pedobacter antarcticus TaxID=34086 RepID=A0A081PCC1_9SPHI|nr:hypothetical protein [Pedobacter antarcticus]KEQ28344.1 hypothetical protein N180_01550 [Pedobacter antarcticus 4BY]SFF06283.1 hypothetical protein SAMN03003324_02307 [Pedobacter antarcticus]
MHLTEELAKHLRYVHFGGNWTTSNLKDNLKNVTWQQATTKLQSFNTIAALVFHINYYINAVEKVLAGETLQASDKYSFDVPPINSERDWNLLLEKAWTDAENFALHIEKLPDSILSENFTAEKYGSYYRNIQGIIEHSHYHLGQIVILKKLLQL